MSLFCPLKYITNVTESKSTQIMKIEQVIHNYYIKPDKTLDIYIVRLLSFLKPYSIKIAILKTFCINPW